MAILNMPLKIILMLYVIAHRKADREAAGVLIPTKVSEYARPILDILNTVVQDYEPQGWLEKWMLEQVNHYRYRLANLLALEKTIDTVYVFKNK